MNTDIKTEDIENIKKEDMRHCSYCSNYFTDGVGSYCAYFCRKISSRRRNVCKFFLLDKRYI